MARPRAFEQLTSNIDILPTLLDLLKVTHPNGIDGRSWMGLIHGRAEKGREHVVTHVNTVASGMAFPMRAIQDERYSLVFSPWSDGKLEFQVESMSGLTFNAMKQAAESNAGVASRVKQSIFGFPLAFYDLETDPDQRVNRIDTPRYQSSREHDPN
jgi:N-sulfoglucosamine sulfohydrolase